MVYYEKMKFEDLEFVPTKFNDGIRARAKFPNGLGASIIKSPFSYGNEQGLFELAIIDHKGNIVYDTGISNDVIGYLTPDDINNILLRIESIPYEANRFPEE